MAPPPIPKRPQNRPLGQATAITSRLRVQKSRLSKEDTDIGLHSGRLIGNPGLERESSSVGILLPVIHGSRPRPTGSPVFDSLVAALYGPAPLVASVPGDIAHKFYNESRSRGTQRLALRDPSLTELPDECALIATFDIDNNIRFLLTPYSVADVEKLDEAKRDGEPVPIAFVEQYAYFLGKFHIDNSDEGRSRTAFRLISELLSCRRKQNFNKWMAEYLPERFFQRFDLNVESGRSKQQIDADDTALVNKLVDDLAGPKKLLFLRFGTSRKPRRVAFYGRLFAGSYLLLSTLNCSDDITIPLERVDGPSARRFSSSGLGSLWALNRTIEYFQEKAYRRLESTIGPITWLRGSLGR